MPRFRVVFGLEVEAVSPAAAYERASAFTGFLLERKAAAHPALIDVTPVIGPAPATEVYALGLPAAAAVGEAGPS